MPPNSDRPAPPQQETISTHLSQWAAAIDMALDRGRAADAVTMAQIVLKRLPQHLPTYQRLLRATWALGEWEEGAEWGRRLLQADPNQSLAWRAIAQAEEERGDRAGAQAIWQRAFESDPYAADIRIGLSRTSLNPGSALRLNRACLASLYLRGYRWQHAAATYHALISSDPRRVDYQIGLTVALWQHAEGTKAYGMAWNLVKEHPHLLLAWTIIAAIGDANDQALAKHPIVNMDPSGEYVKGWLHTQYMPSVHPRPAVMELEPALLTVSAAEARYLGEPAQASDEGHGTSAANDGPGQA